MLEWTNSLRSWFWNEDFWLPDGVKWREISQEANKNYPNFCDVFTYPLLMCLAFQMFRVLILNPFVLVPFARISGMKIIARKKPKPNIFLKKLMIENKGTLTTSQIQSAAAELNWSDRQVERWIRRSSIYTKPSKLDKFLYSSYLAFFHFCSIILGSFLLYGKPWVTDISLTLIGLPFHEISSLSWWYHMLSTGFYCSVSIFSHHNAKVDIIHHVCTLTSLTVSWTCNLVRAASLVLFLHEFGDLSLQISKMFDYLEWKREKNISIGVFAVVFVVTRAIIFPFWIIKNMIAEPSKHMNPPPIAYIFYTCLILLFLVNLYWCYLVLLVVGRTLFKGAVLVDVRSESSVTSSDETEITHNSKRP